MAAGDLITADGEFEYNGFLFGGTQTVGVTAVMGLEDLAELRTFDRPRAFADGSFLGTDLLGERSVRFELLIAGQTQQALRSALDDVLDAFVSRGADEIPLVWQLPNTDVTKKQISCRPLGHANVLDPIFDTGSVRIGVELRATDPLIYDATQQSLNTGLTDITSGLSFPLEFPLDFGGTGQASAVTATNDGNTDAPFTVRFDGPATVVSIRHSGTGAELEVATTINAGQFLELDTRERTVLLNGTSSRYAGLSAASEWFDLAPGDNQLVFGATTTGSPEMTVTWRSAWE